MADFNKGDISEGILGAAVAARFVSKTRTITNADVLSIIQKLNKAKADVPGFTSVTKFPSPNLQKNVKDVVILKVNLAKINMNAFLRMSTYQNKEVVSLVSASVNYANSQHISKWADMMYQNGQQNTIEVNSEGLLDQTGTKVDLRVIIDGKQASVGVSLKAGDVKQFGQVGGASIESLESLFSPLGIKFTGADKTAIENGIGHRALMRAYKSAFTQLQTIVATDQKKLKSNLAKFIKFHATRNEENVALVQLNKGQATVYLFEEVAQKLKYTKILVGYQESNTDVIPNSKIPQILFYGDSKDSKNLLLVIRVKLEGNRVNSKGKKLGLTIRNYIEKGHLTTKLLAS